MYENRESSTRGENKDWPRSVLIILGSTLIFAAFGLYHWVGHQPSVKQLFNKVTNMSQAGLITSAKTLYERDKDLNIDGATVLLQSVRVNEVLGNFVFTVDLGEQESMPVVLLGEITERQAEDKVQIEVNQNARIYGILLPLKGISTIAQEAFMNESEKVKLKSYDHYISALRVEVLY